MGDRCYLRLTLHGELDSSRHLVKIAKAIVAENMLNTYGADNTIDSVYVEFARFIEDGTENPEFTDDECNYGNIDALEEVLQQCGMAYSVYHGAGGSYSAEVWSWMPERGRWSAECTEDGDAVIGKFRISKALEAEYPIAVIKELIQRAEWAEGTGMPQFTLGGRARRALASRLAVKALAA